MKVRWSKRAMRQWEKAAEYIAGDRPLVALRWSEELVAAMQQVAGFPESGRVVRGIDNPLLREIVYQDVRVVYRIDPKELVVLFVWHTRRDPRKLLRQLQAYRVPT